VAQNSGSMRAFKVRFNTFTTSRTQDTLAIALLFFETIPLDCSTTF